MVGTGLGFGLSMFDSFFSCADDATTSTLFVRSFQNTLHNNN